jgi:uncharacterized protein (TIGR02996 family)
MHPDELALLRAIAAAPDDDTPRLVLADWLDEHGQAIRAEFIRLQCAIARIEMQPRHVLDQYVDLFKRQQELLDDHRSELAGPLAKLGKLGDIVFRRGFIETVTLDVNMFLDWAPELAALCPPAQVAVEEVAARLNEFLHCPHLTVVNRVAAYSACVNGFANWLDPPDQPDLIAACERLTRLETLDLEGCQIGDAGVRLLTATNLPSLVDLDLSYNDITDFGVADLLDWPLVRQLKRLVLGGNPITDQAAFEIADRLGPRNQLETLNLRFTNIGPAGQNALLPRFGGRVDLF